ncbi:MAG TPA: pterin-4-alpha-carbinolamine dehydratase [Dehalococcoidia bacterium]|nr:pterin-4-alpha-carbinolamine dehydratase [Dehalococcoidia bacterium]|tara:strand:- start:12 stop:302 length:291 start_codon:yes stop_codon:yes gene_type:complete
MSKLSDAEIAEAMPEVPGWAVVEEEGMMRLQRDFTFDDFASALEFTNKVGDLAESENHHPRIVTEWGRVILTWWSHEQRGMVAADVEMAKKVDSLS